MKRAKLTQTSVAALPYSKTRYLVADTLLDGFAVRVGARDKTFVISASKDGRRIRKRTVARFGAVSVELARKKARELLARFDLGLPLDGDESESEPELEAELEAEPELTFAYLAERYQAQNKRKSAATDAARINRHLVPAFGPIALLELTRPQIIAFNARIGTEPCGTKHCLARRGGTCNGHPIEANRLTQLIHRIYEVGRDLGIVPEMHPNPAARLARHRYPETKKQDRAATQAEVRELRTAIWTTENPALRVLFWLYTLTGLRKREALQLKWEHVNLGERTQVVAHDGQRYKLPARTALVLENKSQRPFKLPLSSAAVELLGLLPKAPEQVWVFPAATRSGHLESVDKQWRRVRDLADTTLTIHDLRATVASWASARGTHDRLVQAMLNHAQPRLGELSRYVDKPAHELLRDCFEDLATDVLSAAGVESASHLAWPPPAHSAAIIPLFR